jgi:hypothetical protein
MTNNTERYKYYVYITIFVIQIIQNKDGITLANNSTKIIELYTNIQVYQFTHQRIGRRSKTRMPKIQTKQKQKSYRTPNTNRYGYG